MKNVVNRMAKVASLTVLLYPAAVYAYVDPSSSLLMLQGLLAALGAVLVFVRAPIETIKKLISRFRGK